jgi:ADP-ribose pyrophosphatase YjhB (NUDIX family)
MNRNRSGGQTQLASRLITTASLITRPMTLGVRALTLDSENRVLLVRHTYVKGYWLPGGGVERGESLLQALGRELKEEGNIEFSEDAAHLRSVYLNREVCSFDHVALFVVREFKMIAPFRPNWEIAESSFFPLDKLPVDVERHVPSRINEVINGVATSQFW